MDRQGIKALPKAELHCHLDGSLRPETVRCFLAGLGTQIPEKELRKALRVPPDCTRLADYLKCFDIPLRCLQNERSLRQAAFDLLETASQENVRYLEVRFAPSMHKSNGLTHAQIIESVLEGLRDGQKAFSIHAGLIVCAMRHLSVEENTAMLRDARAYLGQGVCALDLAGDEASFPPREQGALFALAQKLEMPFTIHAGECGSLENVREAIELGARRIGHGIALMRDEALISLCEKKHIGIEMCPTSNFQTRAVDAWASYPLKGFLEKGLPVTVSTDNRTVSGTSLTEELEKAAEGLALEDEQLILLQRNAVETAFADDHVKHMLLKEIGG